VLTRRTAILATILSSIGASASRRVGINSLFRLPFVPFRRFSQLDDLVGTFMSLATIYLGTVSQFSNASFRLCNLASGLLDVLP
jgi:hypothetical protein